MRVIYDLCMSLYRLTGIEAFNGLGNAVYKAETVQRDFKKVQTDAKAAHDTVKKKTGT